MKYSLLNEQFEIRRVVEMYKPFPGKNIDQMPLLLEEGRSPLWTARFMRRRIDHSDSLPVLLDYLDTSDLIAYDSKKRSNNVKFVLTVDKDGKVTAKGRKALDLINLDTKLTSDYAIHLDERYDELQGIVVPNTELGVLERNLFEEEILESKTWRILARHPDEVPPEFAEDKNLLKEYAMWVKSHIKQNKFMGIYIDSNSDVAKLRAWYVSRLETRSNALGRSHLGNDVGRFLGYLAPEAPNT